MKKLALAGLVIMVLAAVAGCGGSQSASTRSDKKQTDQTLQRVKAKVGFPRVNDSLELRNLKRRYELLDDPNKVGYVYLMSQQGRIVSEYTVKGKVSSLNSQFTNPEQVQDCGTDCGAAIGQAEPDGSYGSNPEGIFFFTADGVYVEWGGPYLYAENRLEIQQPADNIILKKAK